MRDGGIDEGLVLSLDGQVVVKDFLTEIYKLDQHLAIVNGHIFNVATAVRLILHIIIVIKFENANLEEVIRCVNNMIVQRSVPVRLQVVLCQLVEQRLQLLQRVAIANVRVKSEHEAL